MSRELDLVIYIRMNNNSSSAVVARLIPFFIIVINVVQDGKIKIDVVQVRTRRQLYWFIHSLSHILIVTFEIFVYLTYVGSYSLHHTY